MALDVDWRRLARHVPNRCVRSLNALRLDGFELDQSTAFVVALEHSQVRLRVITTVNAAKGLIQASFLGMGISAGQLFQASDLVLVRLISRLDLLKMANSDQIERCDDFLFLLMLPLVVAMRLLAIAAIGLVS